MEDTLVKRVLPHSLEAEQSVIGCMLYSADAIAPAIEKLKPDDFYQRQYGMIFEALMELYQNGKPTDIVTLQNTLRMKDVPPEIYSIEFLRGLLDSVFTTTSIGSYVNIVQEKAQLRKMIKTLEELTNNCYLGKEKTEELMDQTEKQIFKLLEKRQDNAYEPIEDIVLHVIQRIEDASKNTGTVTGLETGFTMLDNMTSGMQPSDLILIAARPSMGKTAFALNIADYFAVKKGYTTAVFELEMSREQLVNRMLSMESHVDSQHMRTGQLSDMEWDDLVAGSSILSESKLIIDDTPAITPQELRSKCRKYKLEYGLQAIIIDYLQLMSGGGKGSESRQQEISEISRSLKAIARELNVPVLALSQLSRACETRTDHRPMLSDLRESGAIEQDADIVMFIYRDEVYNQDTPKKGVAEIIIAKQRNGPIGTVELAWIANLTKFANIEYRNGD